MKTTFQKYKYEIEGTYTYTVKDYDGRIISYNTKVTAIGESGKSYKVRLHAPIRNHCIGDVIIVQKKNVRFDTPNPNKLDTVEAWWND